MGDNREQWVRLDAIVFPPVELAERFATRLERLKCEECGFVANARTYAALVQAGGDHTRYARKVKEGLCLT